MRVSPTRGSPLEESCQYFPSAGQPAGLAFGGAGRTSLGGFRFSSNEIRHLWWEGHLPLHDYAFEGLQGRLCTALCNLVSKRGSDRSQRVGHDREPELNGTDQVGELE